MICRILEIKRDEIDPESERIVKKLKDDGLLFTAVKMYFAKKVFQKKQKQTDAQKMKVKFAD